MIPAGRNTKIGVEWKKYDQAGRGQPLLCDAVGRAEQLLHYWHASPMDGVCVCVCE